MKKLRTLVFFVPIVASLAIAANEPSPGSEATSTIITSDGPLEMHNNGVDSYSVFKDNVHLTGTNLEVTCDKLEIFVDRQGEGTATIGKMGGVRRILATGHVVILQAGRKATCGRAEVLPREEKIVLSENPEVTQGDLVTTGETITITKGDATTIVVDKPRAVGPPMRNLGFAPQPGDATTAPATPPSTSPAPSR